MAAVKAQKPDQRLADGGVKQAEGEEGMAKEPRPNRSPSNRKTNERKSNMEGSKNRDSTHTICLP
jgi:hypothetical protein